MNEYMTLSVISASVVYMILMMLVCGCLRDRIADRVEAEKVSGRRMHKTRYNQKLEYIDQFERWLRLEPPMILFWMWIRWKKRRPTWKDVEKGGK